MIRNYNDFCRELLVAGFSQFGGKGDGIVSLIRYGWGAEQSDVHWYTGDPDTDPWEWRIRVLDERNDIAYSKVFFRKAGFITKEWYPYFIAARRNGQNFDEAYSDGTVSHFAKRIYDLLRDNGSLPLHIIKSLGGFGKADKSRFDSAVTDLQMRLFITMNGKAQKISKTGEEYGWASTAFCTVEQFWPQEVFEKADKLTPEEASEAITERIYQLNPAADKKKISKFVLGR